MFDLRPAAGHDGIQQSGRSWLELELSRAELYRSERNFDGAHREIKTARVISTTWNAARLKQLFNLFVAECRRTIQTNHMLRQF